MPQSACSSLAPESSALVPRTAFKPPHEAADVFGQLIVAIGKGDEHAFARLYKLMGGRLLSLSLRILGRRADAEDVVQETFLRIWRSASRFDPAKGSAYAWIVTIARNRALSKKASASRDGGAPRDFDFEAIPYDGPDALSAMMNSEEARRVRGCLQKVAANSRRSMELVYFEGLTHRELAERLRVPIGTAKSWVRRGLDQLGLCLSAPVAGGRERVAREYALGALQGAARRGFERRRERDARYCGATDWWERSLAMLTLLRPDRGEASEKLWPAICRAIARSGDEA